MQARPLTTEEIEAVREHLERRSARDRCIFEIGTNCGLRVSELVSLDNKDVWQYNRPVSRLELTLTKGGKPRAVPLNQKAKAAISALMEQKAASHRDCRPTAPLFLNDNDHRLSRHGVQYVLKDIYCQCELSGKLTTHSLRKTFATRLLNNGVTLREIQHLLGHSSLATTERYLSITEDQLSRAVASLEG